MEKKALKIIQGIDFEMLKRQKSNLIKAIAMFESIQTAMGNEEEMSDSLTGILNLIDSLQDFAVDDMGVDEIKVFEFSLNSPQNKKYEEEQQWNVPITRIGYAYNLIAVSAYSEQEAINKAIDAAGGESFSDNSSEYIAPDGAHRITDENK